MYKKHTHTQPVYSEGVWPDKKEREYVCVWIRIGQRDPQYKRGAPEMRAAIFQPISTPMLTAAFSLMHISIGLCG